MGTAGDGVTAGALWSKGGSSNLGVPGESIWVASGGEVTPRSAGRVSANASLLQLNCDSKKQRKSNKKLHICEVKTCGFFLMRPKFHYHCFVATGKELKVH